MTNQNDDLDAINPDDYDELDLDGFGEDLFDDEFDDELAEMEEQGFDYDDLLESDDDDTPLRDADSTGWI